jgi:phytoene dehydrogenase-like protein
MGAFKPANRSKEVDGMYLAGGAAHPGPGMPMVMMSGWIAADSLDMDAKNPASTLSAAVAASAPAYA